MAVRMVEENQCVVFGISKLDADVCLFGGIENVNDIGRPVPVWAHHRVVIGISAGVACGNEGQRCYGDCSIHGVA